MGKAWESGKILTIYDTQNLIPLLNSENPESGMVYSKVLQRVNYTPHSSIASLAALKKKGRKVCHLRFKDKNWYNTLNYNQSGFKLDQDHGILKLSKIGVIKIKLHRNIEGCIKIILIKHIGKRWFAVVQAKQENEPLPQTGNALGLDVGLKSFIVDSDGNPVENPRFAENAAVKITGVQRRLSRAQKGPNYRQKLRDKLDNAHEQINNQRSGFLHKLSRTYANGHDIICVEDLDVKGLKEIGNSKGTHRNIHDASWSKFMFMRSYKAQRAGRKLIAVDPRNTAQRCSSRSSIVRKELSDGCLMIIPIAVFPLTATTTQP
jgi:putative transposase